MKTTQIDNLIPKSKFQYSTDQLTQYMIFKKPPELQPTQQVTKIMSTFTTSIVAHQVIYLLQPKTKNIAFNRIEQSIWRNFRQTRRPTEHTITVFTLKILTDLLDNIFQKHWSEYSKGGAVGVLSYIFSRPLDQIDRAREEIRVNEKKYLSRFAGLRVVIKHDGFSGLYKNQNLFAPLSACIYRSIFFGMFSKLSSLNKTNNPLLEYFLIPFASSLSASLATVIPDKFRSFSFSLNEERSKAIMKKYRQKEVELKPSGQLLMQYVGSKEFRLRKNDLVVIGNSVLRNSLILSLFVAGQNLNNGRVSIH